MPYSEVTIMILWFTFRYAATPRREIFGVNALRGKVHQLGSPNLHDFFENHLHFSTGCFS